MIFVHLGAGAGDLDERANFRCGFTEFIKKNVKIKDKIFVLEANPKNIPKLRDCYKHLSNVNISNLGISIDNEKKLIFYYTDDDAPHYQVCTTKIDHLKKHYPNSTIKKFEIPSLSILLINNSPAPSSSILFIYLTKSKFTFFLPPLI